MKAFVFLVGLVLGGAAVAGCPASDASAAWAPQLWLGRGGYWRQRVRVTIANGTPNAVSNASVVVRVPALKGTRKEAWRLVDVHGTELEYAVKGDDALVVPAVVDAQTSGVYCVYWDNDAAWGLSDFWPKAPDAKCPLQVSVGDPERLDLRSVGADAPWAGGDWDYRVAVNVYNFADAEKRNVLVSVDADEVLRATRAPVFALMREGRALPAFRMGRVLCFETSVPARSALTCWAYVRGGTMTSDGRPKPVELSKLGSEIPSDQVYNGSEVMSAADRALLRRFADSPANRLKDVHFAEDAKTWRPQPRKGVTYATEDDPLFGRVACMAQGADKSDREWVGRRQSVSLVGGRTYVVGAFMKGEGTTNGDAVHLHVHDGKSVRFSSTGGGKSGTYGWHPAFTLVNVPPGGSRLEVHLTSSGRGTLSYALPLVAEACAGVVGTVEAKPVAASAFATEQVSPLVKVFRETPVRDRARPLALSLARNETEGLQLAVKCGTDAAVTAEMTPPVSESGRTLSVETGVVGFVPVDFPSSYYGRKTPERVLRTPDHGKSCDGFTGWWPDPVEPGNRLVLKANETGAFVFSVHADATAESGTYRSEIRWSRNGVEVRREPVSVTVWNFTLPERPAFAATYDIRLTRPLWRAPGEKDDAAARRRMKDAMAKYGLCPDSLGVSLDFRRDKDGNVTADFAEHDRAAAEFFDRYRFPNAYMPGGFYGFGWGHPPRPFLGETPYEGKSPYAGADRSQLRPAYKAAYQAALRLYWEHVKAKGWADRLVLYISDEPYMDMPEVRAQMKAMCAMIHEVDPAIRIYSSTWRHCADWDRSLDVWGVGAYGCFPTNEMMRLSREGKGIWFTTDGQQCLDTPFCAIERLQPVYCWAYGAEKYEFWGCSWLTQDPRRFGWHHFIRQSGKPGETSWVRYPNGDGYHFYPPADPAKDPRPVPSLRAMAIRDGVEEYAYLKALERLAASSAPTSVRMEAERLLKEYRALVPIPNAGGRHSTKILPSPAYLDDLHRRAGELLSSANRVQTLVDK